MTLPVQVLVSLGTLVPPSKESISRLHFGDIFGVGVNDPHDS